jgi:hypothetical protein
MISFQEGGEKKMRRFLLVFLALILLIDLADDGFPGKARFVSPASGSVASCSQYIVEQVDSWCGSPVPDALEIFSHYQNQTVTFSSFNNFNKIIFCHTNSSGGMPL